MWVLVALVAGSVLVSDHKTEEECLGRKALVEKNMSVKDGGVIVVKCVDMRPITSINGATGSIYVVK